MNYDYMVNDIIEHRNSIGTKHKLETIAFLTSAKNDTDLIFAILQFENKSYYIIYENCEKTKENKIRMYRDLDNDASYTEMTKQFDLIASQFVKSNITTFFRGNNE